MSVISPEIHTETDVIEAVDRIVAELERALLDEDVLLATDLHTALTGPAASAAEREDRVLQVAWRLAAEDRLFRRAS